MSATRRPRRWVVALVGAAALSLFGLDIAILVLRTRSHPVSLDTAVARYRREASIAAPDAASTTSTAFGSMAPSSDGGPRPTANSAPPGPDAPNGARTGRPALPDTSPSPAEAWRPPASGVYTYRTEGSARFRIARHDYPSQTHAIVHSGDDCRWSLRHSLVEEDVDEYTYCTGEHTFQWFSWSISRSFFGVRQGWDYRCSELVASRADLAARRGFTVDCATEDGDRAIGKGSFVGVVGMTIDGVAVQAYHFLIDVELQGSFQGRLTGELWLEGRTGLRLRELRTIDGSIPAGPYHEELELEIASLRPAT